MIGEVFRFEIGYRLRQPSTWIYAAVLFAVPFLMMHAINGSSQFLNAPEMVINASAILGGIGMLVSAGVFGDAAARDVRFAHARPLLHVAASRTRLRSGALSRRRRGERGAARRRAR
jgi:hypothetical protein